LIDLWRAAIVIIGNEILIGRVLDTNSQRIARALTMMGYEVVEIRKVRDDVDAIAKAIKDLFYDVGVIITTGGLGPTYDDVTAEALSLALGLPMEINQKAKEMIERKAREMGLELTKERLKMAMMPVTSRPIPNSVGMAPGIYIRFGNKKIFALPGVPTEAEAMLDYVLSELESDSLLKRAEVCEKLENVREADIAEIIKKAAKMYPDSYIKTHPGMEGNRPVVKVCVLASDEDAEMAERKARKILNLIIDEVRKA
jgi:molybdenum cofactor synthesis domain-containing protein